MSSVEEAMYDKLMDDIDSEKQFILDLDTLSEEEMMKKYDLSKEEYNDYIERRSLW